MGNAGMVLPLAGRCLEVPLDLDHSVRKCVPFREFCIHTVMSNPYGAGSVDLTDIGGTYSCGKASPASAEGTGSLPVFSTPADSVPVGKVYGKTADPVSLTHAGAALHFKSTDLIPWGKRDVYPVRRWMAQGPAVTAAHCAVEVRRRLKGTENNGYHGRSSWQMVDSSQVLKQGADWLAPMHPANCVWTNSGVAEPFLATTHFELCGQKPAPHFHFCKPLKAYSDASLTALAGTYTGFHVLHAACSGVIRKPLRQCSVFPCQANPSCGVTSSADKDNCAAGGHLPEDYLATPDPLTGKRPPVNPTWQFMMVETAVFMVGDTINSPRVGTIRHWLINKPLSDFQNPCDEYFYTHHSSMQEWWRFPVLFETDSGKKTIDFNLSGFQVYCAP